MFKRVLPLPNGNWNAIVDDWCCHPDPFAKKLLPRSEDCLLGDTFLLLARDDSCKETLSEEMNPVGAEDGQDPKVSMDHPDPVFPSQSTDFYSWMVLVYILSRLRS